MSRLLVLPVTSSPVTSPWLSAFQLYCPCLQLLKPTDFPLPGELFLQISLWLLPSVIQVAAQTPLPSLPPPPSP